MLLLFAKRKKKKESGWKVRYLLLFLSQESKFGLVYVVVWMDLKASPSSVDGQGSSSCLATFNRGFSCFHEQKPATLF